MRQDITGRSFNRLTAMWPCGYVQKRDQRAAAWLFLCSCGHYVPKVAADVVKGAIRSCGCAFIDAQIARSTRHGHAKHGHHSSEWSSWQNMLARCGNPKHTHWKYYGGRGISVCQRWKTFEYFLADMGPKPDPSYTIDRWPNGNGNYEPGNCRWATRKEQGATIRRRTHCKRGHALTPENTTKDGANTCVICRRVRVREWMRAHRRSLKKD